MPGSSSSPSTLTDGITTSIGELSLQLRNTRAGEALDSGTHTVVVESAHLNPETSLPDPMTSYVPQWAAGTWAPSWQERTRQPIPSPSSSPSSSPSPSPAIQSPTPSVDQEPPSPWRNALDGRGSVSTADPRSSNSERDGAIFRGVRIEYVESLDADEEPDPRLADWRDQPVRWRNYTAMYVSPANDPAQDLDGQLLFFPRSETPKAPSRKTRSHLLSASH